MFICWSVVGSGRRPRCRCPSPAHKICCCAATLGWNISHDVLLLLAPNNNNGPFFTLKFRRAILRPPTSHPEERMYVHAVH